VHSLLIAVVIRAHLDSVILVQKKNRDEAMYDVPTKESMKKSITSMMRAIVMTCGQLDPLPTDRFLKMELIYNETASQVSTSIVSGLSLF
jgi:hypothetical protein